MKKILITGANSYVGTNVEKWLLNEPDKYHVETLDMKDPNWKEFDFSKFDVVFHVAGIAHIKETKKNKYLYDKVNRDLVFDVAYKSKREGVEHFIFMSSMSVFGLDEGKISLQTVPIPKSMYGISKFEGEEKIKQLSSNDFKVCIVRPPMIYGLNAPGNYSTLERYSKYLLFFPNTNNMRSMIYINNLSMIIQNIIDESKFGIFYPDNKDYVNTYNLIEIIRKSKGKPTINIKLLKPLIYVFMKLSNKINKIFGSLYYDQEMKYKHDDILDLENSFEDMVKGNE